VTPLPRRLSLPHQPSWAVPSPGHKDAYATKVAAPAGRPTASGLRLLPIIRGVQPAREDV
jgi:hypothetical protein